MHLLHTLRLLGIFVSILLSKSCSHGTSKPLQQQKIDIFIQKNSFKKEPFISRHFGEKKWQGTLAMNITYKPIRTIRGVIEKKLYDGKPLDYLKSWNSAGEAHITTITPVEYQECMWSEENEIRILHMKKIEKIALAQKIQSSDITYFGLGYGEKVFAGQNQADQTHFVIVRSQNLLNIRKEIYSAYLKNGGDSKCWDPNLFFPHITIGFTHKDIHYPDVKKNMEHSVDQRFNFKIIDENS